MGNLLYIVAVILLIAWAVGFIGYNAGGIIHILLVELNPLSGSLFYN